MSIFCHFNKIIHIQNQSSKFKFLNFFFVSYPFLVSFNSKIWLPSRTFGNHPWPTIDQLGQAVHQFPNEPISDDQLDWPISEINKILNSVSVFVFCERGRLSSKDTYCYRKIRILFTQVQPTMNLLDFRNVLAYIYAIFRFSEL